MMNKAEFKISIGALAGSIIVSGAAYTLLNKLSGRTLIPFYQETIKECAVNKKTLSINYTNNENVKIEETIEKEYILEEQIKNMNAIELNIHSPYFIDDNNDIYIKHYQYTYSNSLSIKEIEEKIELLESGNLDELVKDGELRNVYIESPIIIPASEENKLKAEMTIHNVDYNDYKVKKQSLDADFNESMILTFSTLAGGGLGALVQETIKIENEIINMNKQTKSKKRVKKKDKKSN